MNEQQIIEFYPAICKWLGKEYIQCDGFILDENGRTLIDFLHDLNQLQWVEDKLDKEDYGIEMSKWGHNDEWLVTIWDKNGRQELAQNCNKSRPLALLQAVSELIKEENENKT